MFGLKKKSQKMPSYTESWFEEEGNFLINRRCEKYGGKVPYAWLSNFDIVPRGVHYEDLSKLIKSPCEYVKEFDDIRLIL